MRAWMSMTLTADMVLELISDEIRRRYAGSFVTIDKIDWMAMPGPIYVSGEIEVPGPTNPPAPPRSARQIDVET